jgi:hypothetical protein
MGVFGVRGFKFDDGCIKRDYVISSLKSFIIASLSLKYKKSFVKALVGAPFKF